MSNCGEPFLNETFKIEVGTKDEKPIEYSNFEDARTAIAHT